MRRTGLLTAVTLACLLHATEETRSGELIRGLHRLLHSGETTPSWAGNPRQPPLRRVVYPRPEPRYYPEYVNPAGAPRYGYGFGVPTYNWGDFGVKHRGRVFYHRGYHGDFRRYRYRDGY